MESFSEHDEEWLDSRQLAPRVRAMTVVLGRQCRQSVLPYQPTFLLCFHLRTELASRRRLVTIAYVRRIHMPRLSATILQKIEFLLTSTYITAGDAGMLQQ